MITSEQDPKHERNDNNAHVLSHVQWKYFQCSHWFFSTKPSWKFFGKYVELTVHVKLNFVILKVAHVNPLILSCFDLFVMNDVITGGSVTIGIKSKIVATQAWKQCIIEVGTIKQLVLIMLQFYNIIKN
jgi:hypothetical protein